MTKLVAILICGFIFSSSLYANRYFTTVNKTGYDIKLVKIEGSGANLSIDRSGSNLWCDGHKETPDNPCIVSAYSSKEFTVTTNGGEASLRFAVKTADAPVRLLCDSWTDQKPIYIEEGVEVSTKYSRERLQLFIKRIQ